MILKSASKIEADFFVTSWLFIISTINTLKNIQ